MTVRRATSGPSPAPRWPLWPAPRRPLASPWPPSPTTVLGPLLPRQETTPQRNQPWIGVQSVACGALAHATNAPHSRPPWRRRGLLRSRPPKEDGCLGMPQVDNPMRPRPLSTLTLRVTRRPLRPPPIDVDASQGTATQLAGLLNDEAGALSPLEPLPPAVVSDDDPEPPAAGDAGSPPGGVGPHESRLAALIADTALEEANPCRAMDVAVFLDSERLSAVGRRMRAAGQNTTPVPGPHSPEGDGLPSLLAQYAKRTRELLQLVGFTLGVPSFSLSSWEGDAIPAPHPPGLGITVYYVIEGRVQLRLPTPEGGTRPGWWLQAMAYVYAWSAPPLLRAVPPDTRALVLICQCPVHVPRGTPATAPPPPPGPNLRQAWGPVRPGRHGGHGPRGS